MMHDDVSDHAVAIGKAASPEKIATRKADFLLALGHRHRLHILLLLKDKSMNIVELSEILSQHQGCISRHLTHLREKNIVRVQRRDGQLYFTLSSSRARKMLDTLADIYQFSTE